MVIISHVRREKDRWLVVPMSLVVKNVMRTVACAQPSETGPAIPGALCVIINKQINRQETAKILYFTGFDATSTTPAIDSRADATILADSFAVMARLK